MIFDFLRIGSPPPRTDRHVLAGTVTVGGSPGKRLVLAFDRLTDTLLAARWSEPTTGAWRIAGLPEYPANRILIVGIDPAGANNAVAADYLSQVTG